MQQCDELIETLRGFVLDSFAPGLSPRDLPADLDLLRKGILDSLKLVEAASFVEELADAILDDDDLAAENFRTLSAMAALVRRLRDGG